MELIQVVSEAVEILLDSDEEDGDILKENEHFFKVTIINFFKY